MMQHGICCSPSYIWELCCLVLSLLLASNIWMFFRVLRPLKQLSRQAERISQGDFVAINEKCGGIAEIGALRRSMASMVRHVRRSQNQTIRYADNLTEGQEAERLRIARELHDDTIQSLIAISQSIDIAKTWLTDMPNKASEMLHIARKQSVETVANLRHMIENLRPPALQELGLIPAIKMQIEECETPTQITVKGPVRRLDEARELALFRITQEALNNIKRHALATEVDVIIDFQPSEITTIIEDNGIGFEVPQFLNDLVDDGHYGIMGIQERVHQLDGVMMLRSKVNEGTRFTIRIPTEPIQQPQNIVRDPVCSAIIQPEQAYASLSYRDDEYYFCCPVCQGAFQKDPQKYVHSMNLELTKVF